MGLAQADRLANALDQDRQHAFAAGDDFGRAAQAELDAAAKVAAADFVGVQLDADQERRRRFAAGGCSPVSLVLSLASASFESGER